LLLLQYLGWSLSTLYQECWRSRRLWINSFHSSRNWWNTRDSVRWYHNAQDTQRRLQMPKLQDFQLFPSNAEYQDVQSISFQIKGMW